jgi:hypothetical protein
MSFTCIWASLCLHTSKINLCQEYVIQKNAYTNILLKENIIVVILLKINNIYFYMCPW